MSIGECSDVRGDAALRSVLSVCEVGSGSRTCESSVCPWFEGLDVIVVDICQGASDFVLGFGVSEALGSVWKPVY